MFKNIKLRKALIGAGLGVLGVGAVVGTTWSINHFISQKQNVDDIEDLTPGTPIIDGVEVGENDAVHEMPKQITFTRYSKVATSNNTLNVTCSVLPENTANKKLTWALAWQDGGNHGTVTDYVKMSISTDTHTVTLQSLKEWTNKISLTVKTVDGSNLSKSCTLDYLGRNVSFGSSTTSIDGIDADTNIENLAYNLKNSITGTVTGGTLQGSVEIDQVAFTLSDNGGDTQYVDNYIDGFNNSLVSSTTTFGQYIEANYASLTCNKNKLTSARDAFDCFTDEGVGYVYVKYHLVYSGSNYKTVSTYTYVLKNYSIDFRSKLTATSLSLNDTSFIF